MKINYEKTCIQLGKMVRALREERGLSQEEFAGLCGVHRTYMGSIERGERNISMKNILRISAALEIKPSELLAKAGQ